MRKIILPLMFCTSTAVEKMAPKHSISVRRSVSARTLHSGLTHENSMTEQHRFWHLESEKTNVTEASAKERKTWRLTCALEREKSKYYYYRSKTRTEALESELAELKNGLPLMFGGNRRCGRHWKWWRQPVECLCGSGQIFSLLFYRK